MFKLYKIITFLILFLLFVIQCSTKKTYIGNTKEYSEKKIKSTVTTLVIKTRNNKKWAELRSPLIYPATISGSIQDNGENLIFDIETIYFLANWPNGWTEGLLEASGRLIFIKENNFYKCEVNDSIAMWDLQKGGIRYRDTFYLDDKGKEKVKQRLKRIQGLTSFLRDQPIPDYFGHIWFKTKLGDSFNKYAKPILLSKGTKFPKYLQDLQTSNTILRDYTEAIDLFFMDYNLPTYFDTILPGSFFR